MSARPDLAPAHRILGPKARVDVSLAPYCTYRVGGMAALWVEARSEADLQLVRRALTEVDCPVLVVGKGSNMLVADAGFEGIVVHLGEEFAAITVDEHEPLVAAGGAALLPVVARKTAAAALTGFEWAVGVPGSIGGAVRMNAGGHGSDMAASLITAGVFDLRSADPAEGVRNWSLDDLRLGYRVSAILPWQIVVDARLRLAPGDRTESEIEISEIVRWRRANQPGGQNAGSVFANPEGDSAGRLIDSLGLKGLRVGTASVSEKHANFIQAEPDGSADDVYRLIRELQRRVLAETGIELHAENKLIGFESIPSTEVGCQ
ncbi:MAG: UDP-N-acetylmuramate dehydrogenase [Acidimicrobiia bacterium]|nr:UDP-N-acetylmuramate dehydrogenase [Acidimicrobiia bacterium]